MIRKMFAKFSAPAWLGVTMLLLAPLLETEPVRAQGFFNKLKEKTRDAVEEGLEQTIGDTAGDAEKEEASPTDTLAGAVSSVSGAPDAGRWQGQVGPEGKGGLMAYGGLEILLDDEAGILRYSEAATRCLAELTSKADGFAVAFVTGQSRCGTEATLALSGAGEASLAWKDAPDRPADEKVYTGTLARTHAAWPERWSTPVKIRDTHDVVGFRLAMSYEDALAHLEAEHPEFGHEWRVLSDPGSTTIVQQLQRKDSETVGPNITHGEQMILLFEAQTPEEMEVEQNPEVLARRAEIERLRAERAEVRRQQRTERMSRSSQRTRLETNGSSAPAAAAQEELPPIPEMPPLRPSGAEGELLVIVRALTFSGNGRPHQAGVTDALVEKYGTPSARIDQGPVRTLQWVFDAAGERIVDAAGGPCEHISKAPGRIEGLVDYYGVKGLYMSQGLQIAIPPTLSPSCGLTVKARLRYDDRDQGVGRLSVVVYDQQRLLGDEWKKISVFSKAYLEEEKAKQSATKAVKAPEL